MCAAGLRSWRRRSVVVRAVKAAAAVALAGRSSAQDTGAADAEAVLHFPDEERVEDTEACPAGTDSAGCKRATGDFEWRAFPGCAIPAGDDVGGGEAELLSVEAAKRRCGAIGECVGFTFEGSDPLGPLSGGPVWVHLKGRFDCLDAEWIAYKKVSRRAAVAPPPPPPRVNTSIVAAVEGDGDGVALCLSGQVRMLQTTGAAMEQNLILVLQPDLFMYGPRDRGQPDGPELFELEQYLTAAKWEDEDIRTHLYSETRNPGRVIDLEYIEVQGNWFGNQCLKPALRDNRPGSAICMYYNQRKCLDMVKEHEVERGRHYEWVVVSRTDFRWVAPHPPLELLSGDAVWIPTGSDWEGGINDRHAVLRRKYADQYLSGWSMITKGEAKDVMLETLGSMKVMGYPGPNTECFLKARLQHYQVPVQRFPNVAYLTCTQRTKSRWTQCSGTSSNDAPGWLYKEEMEHATRIAKCVKSSWTQRKMEDCLEDITHLYRGIR